jgi:hypothetical protein
MKGTHSRDSHPVLFAVRTPVIMNTAIIWDVMPCSLVGRVVTFCRNLLSPLQGGRVGYGGKTVSDISLKLLPLVRS